MKLTTISRFVYSFALGLFVFLMGYTVTFLYNNFYKTIVQSETVYLLRSQVSFEMIDTKKWEDVKSNLADKKEIVLNVADLGTNPFSALDAEED